MGKYRGRMLCKSCGGTGVMQTHRGHTVCSCVRGTEQARAMQAAANRDGAPAGNRDPVREAIARADNRKQT